MRDGIWCTELYALRSGRQVYADTDDVNNGHAKSKAVVFMLMYV
jgi:hypothetical protein